MIKENHFYIDESGDINGKEELFFIHGCLKTDTPVEIEGILAEIKAQIHNDYEYYAFYENFKVNGFHAVDNHPDIRTMLFKILYRINFRAYFVILDKRDDYFKHLMEQKEVCDIFHMSLRKLIFERVTKNIDALNKFYFEQITIKDSSLSTIVKKIFDEADPEKKCYHEIVGKENQNLAIIDYLNYILYSLLKEFAKTKKIKSETMIDNFNLVLPKIASIYVFNTKQYFSRHNNISLDKIINALTG